MTLKLGLFERDMEIKDLLMKRMHADLLRVQGKMSARGIFEDALKGIHHEADLKGNFNAASVCNHLVT